MEIVDLILLGLPLGAAVCMAALRWQRRVVARFGGVVHSDEDGAKGGIVTWNGNYDGGLMAIFTFAGEAFASFFLKDIWMAVLVGCIMVFISGFGCWNRLNSRQSEVKNELECKAGIRRSHLLFVIGVGLALLYMLSWQFLRFIILPARQI